VHYADLNIDTAANTLSPPRSSGAGVAHSDTELATGLHDNSNHHLPRRDTLGVPFSPILRRRQTRAATFRTVSDFEDFDARPGWQPGSEPGVDPSKPDGGHASRERLQAPSTVTVVDFSPKDMEMRRLDNSNIAAFCKEKQPEWATCRWINVNGLSWEVISALGTQKNLHKLAIEDLMNTRNRTKTDWYVI